MRIAALVAVAVVVPAHAYVYCDSPQKGLQQYEVHQALRKEIAQQRHVPLERHFSAVLAAHDAGRIADAEVGYEFGFFAVNRPERESLHRDWIKEMPRSRAAHLAESYYYMQRAWSARGGDWASKTSEVQFAAMADSMRKAGAALEASMKLARNSAPELTKAIELAKMGSGAEAVRRLYRQAIKEHPKTVSARAAYIWASVPQWGGSLEQIAQAVAEAKALPEDERRYLQSVADFATGNAYEHLHKDDVRAGESYHRAMEACPGLSDSALQLIYLYHRTRNWQGLERAATRYLERHPVSGWAFSQRGWAYLSQGKLNESFRDYEKATQLGDGKSFEALAWFHESGRGGAPQDWKKAIDLYMIAHDKGVEGARVKADRIRKVIGIK